MSEDYYEEEPPLRGRGLFGAPWKQLLADHLRDCYRQRRVFREALNNMRTEIITDTVRMHKENQERMEDLSDRLTEGQRVIERLQKWIFGGVISTLVVVLGYFMTHFGPLAVR